MEAGGGGEVAAAAMARRQATDSVGGLQGLVMRNTSDDRVIEQKLPKGSLVVLSPSRSIRLFSQSNSLTFLRSYFPAQSDTSTFLSVY